MNLYPAGRAMHIIYVMENGDKMFARSVNVIEPASGKFTAKGVGTITGGTAPKICSFEPDPLAQRRRTADIERRGDFASAL
jgi:hypothetical protein